MDRYYRVQQAAVRMRGRAGPSDPGFQPVSEDELAAMDELVSAIEDVRQARVAWIEAGRPSLE